jgi:hypothetical protein
MTEAPIDENAALVEVAKALEAEGLTQSMADAAEKTGSPFPPGVKLDPCTVVTSCVRCGSPLNGDNYDLSVLVESEPFKPACKACYHKARDPQPTMQYPQWAAQAGMPTPIDDLRERIAICERAGVLKYRDVGLEITFDPEARKKTSSALPPGTTRTQF